jgi:hypothetical protein
MVVKATHVELELASGRTVVLPTRYGMLHDPDAEVRPKCEVYLAPYTLLPGPAPALSRKARRYLGDHYEGRPARTSLPAAGWRPEGEVRTIWYRRAGNRGHARPREDYAHGFRERFTFWRTPVVLERSGTVRRLNLGRFCVIDDRGFVFP